GVRSARSRSPCPAPYRVRPEAALQSCRRARARRGSGPARLACCAEGCQSAPKFDPAYCLIYECYPDAAIGGDDLTSRDRLTLAAFQARLTAGAVGGSGPP